MLYLKSFLLWLLIIPVAILNGALREKVVEPFLGISIALPLSGIILSACIFIIALVFLPKLKIQQKHDYIVIGIFWFILTNLFEILMLVGMGKPVQEYMEMFNPLSGNLWCLVVMSSFLAPYFAGRRF